MRPGKGFGSKQLSKLRGASHNTIKSYLRRFQQMGMPLGGKPAFRRKVCRIEFLADHPLCFKEMKGGSKQARINQMVFLRFMISKGLNRSS